MTFLLRQGIVEWRAIKLACPFQDLSGAGPESSAQKGPLLCRAVPVPRWLLACCAAGFLAFQNHANHLGNEISQASAEIAQLEADLESAVNALSRAQQVRCVSCMFLELSMTAGFS